MTTATLPRRADMKPLTAYAQNNPIEWVCAEYGPRIEILCQAECLQLLSVLAGYLSELASGETDEDEALCISDWLTFGSGLEVSGDVLSVLETFDEIEDPQHLADILPAIASYARCEDE